MAVSVGNMSASTHASVPVSSGFADGLAAAGVRRMFGMPGGGPNLDMIGAAEQRGIEFVLAHGETAACLMAGAFGLLSGTPGVAIVTRGPGLTSAANGLAQATLDRAPLLVISDRVPAAQRDRTGHQRLDQLAVTAPLTRWTGTLGHRAPARVVAAALAVAAGPPAGAVHLDYDPGLPGDLPPAVPHRRRWMPPRCAGPPRWPPAPAARWSSWAPARRRTRPRCVVSSAEVFRCSPRIRRWAV